MRRYVRISLIGAFSMLALYGCGGGGGGGGAVTKASTKVYLYGNMTSITSAKAYSFSNISSKLRVASVSTSLDIPSAVMVNYSSPGDITGCKLRKGAIIPSGPKLVSQSDFDTSRFNPDPASRKLIIKLLNWGSIPLRSSTTGNGGLGEEIATINFTLTTPGTKPPASFDQQQNVSSDVSVSDNLPNGTTANMSGPKINFVTTYQ